MDENHSSFKLGNPVVTQIALWNIATTQNEMRDARAMDRLALLQDIAHSVRRYSTLG